jgi:hypothetical protein
MSCGLYTVTKAEPSRYVEVALYVGPPGIQARTPYPCEAGTAVEAASFGAFEFRTRTAPPAHCPRKKSHEKILRERERCRPIFPTPR